MKYAFLFGSGLSIPAGMPSTRCLSNTVLLGEGVHRNTACKYYIDGTHTPSGRDSRNDVLRGMFSMLSLVQAEADLYHPLRPSNYEDWFYVAQQIHADLTGNLDNPVAGSLTRDLRWKLEHALEGKTFMRGSQQTLMNGVEEVCNYIRAMVAHELRKTPKNLEYLRWIVDALKDQGQELDAIFTLNHDCLIEELLTCETLSWFDGFGKSREGYCGLFWDAAGFSQAEKAGPINLVKLHGSVSWREGVILEKTPQGGVIWDEHIAFRLRENESPTQEIDKMGPLLLIGRHNKTYDYHNFVFEDLHYRFYRGLQAVDRLVVCGYGFGDKAINTRIINWMNGRRDKKLIIIHDQHPNEWADLRVAALRNMADWERDKRFCWIRARSDTVTWDQIKQEL